MIRYHLLSDETLSVSCDAADVVWRHRDVECDDDCDDDAHRESTGDCAVQWPDDDEVSRCASALLGHAVRARFSDAGDGGGLESIYHFVRTEEGGP